MSQLFIVTTPQNSGDGTPLATAFNYTNSNFSELYARYQTLPPTSLDGKIGDVAGMYASDSAYFYYCFGDYDGSSIIWAQVTQVGNITVQSIQNGTSEVMVTDINGNIATSVGGVSNVIVVSSTGQYVSGQVSATGNVSGAFIRGDGSLLSSLTGANVTGTVANATYAVSAGTAGTVTTAAQPNITSVGTLTSLNSSGVISAAGNIECGGVFKGTFVGNIVATLTGIPGPSGAVVYNDGTGNAAATAGLVFDNTGPNILTVLGDVSATGNIISNNVTGTLLTNAQPNITSVGTLTSPLSVTGNITGSANVSGGNLLTAGLVSATGNIRGGNVNSAGIVSVAGNITATGNVQAGNIAVTGINAGGNISATNYTGATVSVIGNITGSNLNATTAISSAGNIAGTFILGNVTYASGFPTMYANTNAAAFLANFGSNTISTSGDITTTGTLSGNLVQVYGNLNSTGNVFSGNVATTGIYATNITGTLITAAQPNVTSLGVLTSLSVSGNIIGGNLSVGTGIVTVGGIVNANGNAVGNIGSSTNYFNTIFAQSTSAQYADLAENYSADAEYEPGTVVVFGGDKEITISKDFADERVAGVISTNPAHLMNTAMMGLPVALRGRVPVNVIGPVIKGDSLVTSSTSGFAQSVGRDRSYGQAVFAKAIETNISDGEKTITAVIL